ncbi:MAG TPA: hypothetical protein VFX98_05555 [Longimicrobiaceae bacterium]|nr:hypothetical protein [Longimicrobiaceae bacterium]
MRIFTTPDGVEWRAWSVVPGMHTRTGAAAGRHLPEDMMEGWLCFECDREKRRFYPLPADWEERPEGDLLRLLKAAVPVERKAEALSA